MKINICGAFNASVTVRPGESEQQAAERAEEAIQIAMDKYCKRLDVRVGVDYGAIGEAA